jgi:hypothetical protein
MRPDWPAVTSREYHDRDCERLTVDTAGRSVSEAVDALLESLRRLL